VSPKKKTPRRHGGHGEEGEGRREGWGKMLIYEELTQQIIAAAIEVHKGLGPGLLESAYEECLCHELSMRGLRFQRQVSLPVSYKGVKLDCGYRLDLVVEDKVILELKSVEQVTPLHEAQLLTYLRLSGKKVGLLLNFNTPVMKDGIIRLVL
jgi:GxxExxY protein